MHNLDSPKNTFCKKKKKKAKQIMQNKLKMKFWPHTWNPVLATQLAGLH